MYYDNGISITSDTLSLFCQVRDKFLKKYQFWNQLFTMGPLIACTPIFVWRNFIDCNQR